MRKKSNSVKITSVPGNEKTTCTATITIEFDPLDTESAERFARALRELIPEDEREKFIEDFNRAGVKAGFVRAAE